MHSHPHPLPRRALISFSAVATSSTANRMSSGFTISPDTPFGVIAVASLPRMISTNVACRSCKRCNKPSTSFFFFFAMTYISEVERHQLLDLLVIAQQRLDTLKESVASTNDGLSGSNIRIAIGDAITPLYIAFEAAQTL